MPAMFAIVQSTKTPPAVRSLGESFGYSAELTDFLLLCFRKDPSKRPSAHALMGHAWLVGEASVKINPKNPVKKKRKRKPADLKRSRARRFAIRRRVLGVIRNGRVDAA